MLPSNREQQLFLRALEFEEPDEQAGFLREQCGDDINLLESVQELLKRQTSLEGFLEVPAVSPNDLVLTNEPSESKMFGDYDLLDEIDRGGMGIVYRAQQRSLGRVVALKLILSGQFATREQIHRFKGEATASAALQHSNIVAIHEVGVHDGRHFLSMDYVYGQNLAQLVGNRPIPAKKAARYVKEIAEAIHYAHEQGILHRDLKPSNVLVDTASDQPKVTDFGLAKRMDRESSLTMTGQILGSPNFVAPEQVRPHFGKTGRTSDVYGLGGILYFCLTARPPFQGDSLEMTLHQVLHDEPVPPHLLNPGVPLDLETICLKCLNKEPHRRYRTAKEVVEDIDRFLNDEPTLARPTTRIEQAWRWCRRKPAFAGLLATTAFFVLTMLIGLPIVTLSIQKSRLIAESNLYSADLNVVQAALDDADLLHARNLLDRHRPILNQPDSRGFEWRYFWKLCQGEEEYVLEPRVTNASSVAFSNDGHLLAASGKVGENVNVVWNLMTKSVLKTMSSDVRLLKFAPDNPLLISIGTNGLQRWNTHTWENHYLGPCLESSNAEFSPEGAWLVVYGNGLQVWDTRDWSMVSSNDFGQQNFYVHSVLGISRDGSLLSCAQGKPFASTSETRIFRLPSLERVGWSAHLPKDISAATFHPKQDLMVTGGWSGDIRLWDVRSGAELPSGMKQSSRIMAMDFNPADPDLLVTTGGDRTIRIWDLPSHQEHSRLHGAKDQLTKLSFSPDGKTIASGGVSNPVTLWNAAQPDDGMTSVATERRNCVLRYSKDGKQLLTMDKKGQVVRRDANSLAVIEILFQLPNPSATIFDGVSIANAMAISDDAKRIAFARTNGMVELWDLSTHKNMQLEAHTARVRSLAFSPDSLRLVTASEDLSVYMWIPGTPTPVASGKLGEASIYNWPSKARFSPDGERVAVGSGQELCVFHGKTLHRLHQFPVPSPFTALRFNHDGRYLVSGHGGGNDLILWDTHSWNRQFLPGHKRYISDVAFSHDGRRMVSLGEKLVIWDTDTWLQLVRYELPIQSTSHILFSPEGNTLITADSAALRIWRAPSFNEIMEQENTLGRWP